MEICLLEDNQPEFFPNPRLSDNHGLVAMSRGLGIKRLITAYRQGIFPWMKMNKAPIFGVGSLQIQECVYIPTNSKFREA